jgi:hypothetical protein
MVAYVNRLMEYWPRWNNLIHCLNFFDSKFNRAKLLPFGG